MSDSLDNPVTFIAGIGGIVLFFLVVCCTVFGLTQCEKQTDWERKMDQARFDRDCPPPPEKPTP